MSENENPPNSDSDDSVSLSAKISEGLGAALTGIPAPIFRNASKAFSRLLFAAADWPAAYFEMKASEIRAISDARAKLINQQAEEISKQLNVPSEFAEIAVANYAGRIVREKLNLSHIVGTAKAQLEAPSETKSETPEENDFDVDEISGDWLNAFENVAAEKDSEEMRFLFGKILAGEIQQPGSFSIKTVRLVSDFDQEIANLFQALCSICVALRSQDGSAQLVHVPSLGKSASQNGLSDFGLDFFRLNLLEEHGLVISDFNSYFDYARLIPDEERQIPFSISFQGREHAIERLNEEDKGALRINGVQLSKTGMELFEVVDLLPRPDFFDSFKSFLANLGCRLVELESD